MNKQARLERMDAKLQLGIQAKGNDAVQRSALNAIIREAHFANEPVLEWLAEKLRVGFKTQPVLPAVTSTNELECPGCRKPFTSVASLNGHGPARCLDRKAREKGGLIS